MANDLPIWFKVGFFLFVGVSLTLCILTNTGCNRAQDDSLDKISEKVMDTRQGVDIQFRPLPKEK